MKPTTQKHCQPNIPSDTRFPASTARPISTRRKQLLVWLGLVGLAVVLNSLTACAGIIKVAPIPTPTVTPTPTPLPTPRIDVTPEQRRPSMRVVNASLRLPIVDVYLDDRLYIPGVYYSGITNYVPLDPGGHKLRIKPAGIVDGQTILERDWDFQQDRQYTMMLISKQDGLDAPWIFEDNLRGDLLPGKARVRMVHAALSLAAVQICLGNQCDVLAYRQISEYMMVNDGVYNLSVRLAASDAPSFAVLPLDLDSGQVYTVFLLDPEQGEINPRIIPHLDTEPK